MTNADWLDAGVPSDADWPVIVANLGDVTLEAFMAEEGPEVLYTEIAAAHNVTEAE